MLQVGCGLSPCALSAVTRQPAAAKPKTILFMLSSRCRDAALVGPVFGLLAFLLRNLTSRRVYNGAIPAPSRSQPQEAQVDRWPTSRDSLPRLRRLRGRLG